jgi:hypothetical protein
MERETAWSGAETPSSDYQNSKGVPCKVYGLPFTPVRNYGNRSYSNKIAIIESRS